MSELFPFVVAGNLPRQNPRDKFASSEGDEIYVSGSRVLKTIFDRKLKQSISNASSVSCQNGSIFVAVHKQSLPVSNPLNFTLACYLAIISGRFMTLLLVRYQNKQEIAWMFTFVLICTWNSHLYQTHQITANQLTLRDTSCRAHENSTHYFWSTRLDQCGTVARHYKGGMSYINMVRLKLPFFRESGTVVG